MFFNDSDLISAFIVADGRTVIISNPSVATCLLTLLGAYHTWDTTFPTAFKGVLLIFDVFGLGTVTKDTNGAFKKFKQEFVRFKQS